MPPRRTPANDPASARPTPGALEPPPGFKPPTSPFQPPDPSPPANSGPSTTSGPNPSPPPPDQPTPPITSSSPASSDDDAGPVLRIGEDTRDALAAMGAGLAVAFGAAANRAVDRKRSLKTTRWIMSPEEAEAIGDAIGVLAERRIPAALVEGDGEQVLQVGAVLIGYTVRNLMGVSPAELAAATEEFARTGRVPQATPSTAAGPHPPAPNLYPVAPPPRANVAAPAPPPPPTRVAGRFDGIDEAATVASPVIENLVGGLD